MSSNDGGPAFPVSTQAMGANDGGPYGHQDSTSTWQFPGMTLRDYFIAHAPQTPPPWFKPEMPPCPPHSYVSEDGMVKFHSSSAAEKACGFDGYHDENAEAIDAWSERKRREQLLQWPAYWADEMLKRRQA